MQTKYRKAVSRKLAATGKDLQRLPKGGKKKKCCGGTVDRVYAHNLWPSKTRKPLEYVLGGGSGHHILGDPRKTNTERHEQVVQNYR